MPDYTFSIAAAETSIAADVVPDNTYIDTPIDFLLDADGDLDVSIGDLQWVTGLEGVKQACKSALQLALGEWYLDEAAGVDWWGKVLVKNPNFLVVNQIVRDALLGVPFVTEVTSVSVSFTAATRSLAIEWRAVCYFGVVADTTAVLEE